MGNGIKKMRQVNVMEVVWASPEQHKGASWTQMLEMETTEKLEDSTI